MKGSRIETAPLLPEILDGLTYINIHSVIIPSGEIRGQVEFKDPACPCPGDADGNEVVDVNDITFLVPLLGEACPP